MFKYLNLALANSVRSVEHHNTNPHRANAMTPAFQLRQLSDQQLIQRCHIEHCELTSTDAQTVLLERFEKLADNPLVNLEIMTMLGEVDEIYSQLPDEGFLAESLFTLSAIARQLATTKDAAMQLSAEIVRLEELQQQQAHAGEYANEKWRGLTKMLNP